MEQDRVDLLLLATTPAESSVAPGLHSRLTKANLRPKGLVYFVCCVEIFFLPVQIHRLLIA